MIENGTGGKLIAFEGGDFTGKSTQIQLLKEYYEDKGCVVSVTREPGGTELGLALERILKFDNRLDRMTQLMMFLTDQVHHMEQEVRPALREGRIVLCDRYHVSTMVYQLYDIPFFQREWVTMFVNANIIKPDLVLFLSISEQEYNKRRPDESQLDNFEKDKNNSWQRLHDRYINVLLTENTYNLPTGIINADGNEMTVHNSIVETLNRWGM